jgi:hypothetical protein
MSRSTRRLPVTLTALFPALALCLCGGCIADPNGPAPGDTAAQERLWTHTPQPDRILTLRQDLLSLGPEVASDDADELAGVAVRYAERLAADYGMSRPIELHNVMVNMGLRKGGLCYQLADDMFVRVRDMKLKSFDLYRAIADKDDIWHEHNTVVVTARGRPFETGIVLDPWRYAGKLRWIRVAADHHPWKIRPIAGSTQPVRPMDEPPLAASRDSAPPTTGPAARIWEEVAPPPPRDSRVATTPDSSGATRNPAPR